MLYNTSEKLNISKHARFSSFIFFLLAYCEELILCDIIPQTNYGEGF